MVYRVGSISNLTKAGPMNIFPFPLGYFPSEKQTADPG